MKRLLRLLGWVMAFALAAAVGFGADAGPATGEAAATSAAEAEKQRVTMAVAADRVKSQEVHAPDFLEQIVDLILEALNVPASGNTATHYGIAGLLLVGALVLRRVVTTLIFRQLKRIASRTTTTLDDKLFAALEAPVATFVMLIGIFAALKVLKLTPALDRGLAYGSTVAFTLVVFWGLFRSFSALLDHAQETARAKQLGVAAFMPWIKKTLATIFIIFGVLMVIQSFGYDVKAILAGLGLGGLAFALAAQDTLANVFGSVVVAIDQPFKIGEAVKIGSNEGVVEDIGLRSTKLRTPGKNLIIIPNKTVAAEPIINNSRFIRRRFEQVIGLTYAAKPAQLEAIVEEFKRIITSESEVDKNSVMVFFRDFSASSLDIWVVYEALDPDFQKSMRLKQRINLALMRAVESRELSFAFPTQTIELAGAIAEKIADRRATEEKPRG
jgi:MscS family membrane protein